MLRAQRQSQDLQHHAQAGGAMLNYRACSAARMPACAPVCMCGHQESFNCALNTDPSRPFKHKDAPETPAHAHHHSQSALVTQQAQLYRACVRAVRSQHAAPAAWHEQRTHAQPCVSHRHTFPATPAHIHAEPHNHLSCARWRQMSMRTRICVCVCVSACMCVSVCT